MAHLAPAEDHLCLEFEDALTAGALGFMPRILVLTTLPYRRPESHRFERVNGRHSLRMTAPRRIGLPYGSYPRLLLAYLTTQAVRNKSPQIDLGATPNDLARKLGLSTISGPRGTGHRLLEQLLNQSLDTRGWRSGPSRRSENRRPSPGIAGDRSSDSSGQTLAYSCSDPETDLVLV